MNEPAQAKTPSAPPTNLRIVAVFLLGVSFGICLTLIYHMWRVVVDPVAAYRERATQVEPRNP